MPGGAKRPASIERTLAAPKAKEEVQLNPRRARAKSRLPNERLRQQTLTQIDFIFRGPREEPDLSPNEEHLENIAGEDHVQGEQANAKTIVRVASPALPTTPRKKRKLEVPSSHSPPDSPFSPNSMDGSRGPKSPLVAKTEQLLSKSTSRLGTTQGVKRHPPRVLRSNAPWGNEDSQSLLVSPLPESDNISEDVGAQGSVTGGRPEILDTRFEEEADGTVTPCMEDEVESSETTLEKSTEGISGVVVQTEIGDSDDEGDCETDYDFGPETQAMVCNMDLGYLSEPFSEDETSPPRAREVNITSDLQATIDYTDAREISSISDETKRRFRQMGFKEEFTTVKSHRIGSNASPRAYGHSATDGHETEDAQIRLVSTTSEADRDSFQSQPSTSFSGISTSTASAEATLQSMSAVPSGHIKSPASHFTDLDIWMDNHTGIGQAGTRNYDFETASQLLPESLMNDSLPLPPDSPLDFFDEDDY